MLSEARVWGVIPGGFKRVADDGRGYYLVVREDRASEIDLSIFDAAQILQTSNHRGRAPLRSLHLRDGETALIRNYRHGGQLQRLRGAWYASWPPRPFRELAITEELRRRGFRTVEVYAAGVKRGWGPFYRGCLVSREMRGSKDLWSALQDPAMDLPTRGAILKAAAETIVAMHRHGVYHADLNLKNILVRNEHGSVESYVIDFDRAKLFLGKLPPFLARNNLNRLLRSARKLDPERRYLPPAGWNQFLDHYYGMLG
jgi:hypothetical protein